MHRVPPPLRVLLSVCEWWGGYLEDVAQQEIKGDHLYSKTSMRHAREREREVCVMWSQKPRIHCQPHWLHDGSNLTMVQFLPVNHSAVHVNMLLPTWAMNHKVSLSSCRQVDGQNKFSSEWAQGQETSSYDSTSLSHTLQIFTVT